MTPRKHRIPRKGVLCLLISIFLAAVLNVDALAIGVSYGIRKIDIPLASLLLISASSVGYTFAAGVLGGALTQGLPSWTGSLILVGIGCYTLLGALREPTSFDFDASKNIDLKEALALSLALSLDATGVSLSFAMCGGFRLFLPICIGVCQFCFLSFGKRIGAHLSVRTEGKARALNFISGISLMLLGILHLVL